MTKYNSNLNSKLNKKSIGLDLDGVSTKTRDAFLSIIEEKYDTNISRDILYGTNPTIPGIELEYGSAVQEIVSESLDIYRNMSPISGASQATQTLNHKYNIKIITHRVSEDWLSDERREEIRDISIKWLDDNNFKYDDFIYPAPEDKTDVDADIFIDDRPEVLKDITNDEITGILFLRPHNTRYIPDYMTTAADFSTHTVDSLAKNPSLQWSIITEYLINNI